MIILVFIFGLVVGSFLNVLADRLPRGESVLWGRSHCDFCRKPLRWFELIPVVSFLIQGGRCRRCHKSLSAQYPVVELITATGFLLLFRSFMYSPVLLILYALVFSSFLVLFISDYKYQLLPDSMIVTGILGALGILAVSPAPAVILTHGISALGSFAFLYILWAATRGRGMGFGDVKFALLMGLFLGFPAIITAYYVAFLTGATLGVILILVGKKGWKSKIAFGPFLILGTGIAFLWGEHILTLWQKLL